jgi:hypothetical protein
MTFSFVRNTDHQPDTMLTMSVLAFLFVLVKVVLNGVTITAFGNTLNCGTIDGGLIAAMLTPTLGAYVWRRHTDISNNAVQALPAGGGEVTTKSTSPPASAVAVAEVKTT